MSKSSYSLALLSGKTVEEHCTEIMQIYRRYKFMKDEDLGRIIRSAQQEPKSAQDNEWRYMVFAAAKEAVRRVTGLEVHDVQLSAAWFMTEGYFIEMRSAEERLLVSLLASTWLAVQGCGAHIMAVSDEEAFQDYKMLRPIFELLGLQAGMNYPQGTVKRKQQAYLADVTFGGFHEFMADYLHDHLTIQDRERIQTFHRYAIIHDAESVLIRHMLSPLIMQRQGYGKEDREHLLRAEMSIAHYYRQYTHVCGSAAVLTSDEEELARIYGVECEIMPSSHLRQRALTEEIVRHHRSAAQMTWNRPGYQPESSDSLRAAGLTCLAIKPDKEKEHAEKIFKEQQEELSFHLHRLGRTKEMRARAAALDEPLYDHRSKIYSRRDQMWEKKSVAGHLHTHMKRYIRRYSGPRSSLQLQLFNLGLELLEDRHPVLQEEPLTTSELIETWEDLWSAMLRRNGASRMLMHCREQYMRMLDKHWSLYTESLLELKWGMTQGKEERQGVAEAYYQAAEHFFQQADQEWNGDFASWMLETALPSYLAHGSSLA
ncbi:hypothetical protein [Paenibacillus massiliensis]|uniref:hypothetical protein n=1 Tax=Paenibacillus massiliensis TaxID=225917 RepID=UPI00047267D5|nr:hypothetical protein [Paenibacillus massiliensis]